MKVSAMKAGSPKPPNYYCAEIDFTEYVILDVSRTKITGKKRDFSCNVCSPIKTTIDHIERLALDTTNWKGEDIFRIYPFGSRCFASQKFYDFCMKHNFSNLSLVAVE
jgi:hypothetical protein